MCIRDRLRVDVKKELDDKYSIKIEEITKEYLKANEEKKKLENEIKELKACLLYTSNNIINSFIPKHYKF